MLAETQHPYDLYSQKDLLRRPLEPHRALAVDPDNCNVVDDAFHIEEGEDKLGRYTTITSYVADAAIIHTSPSLVSEAEFRAFHRFEAGVSYQILPAFALAQLSLNAPSDAGVPALAVRAKLRNRSVSLTDIERVRVHVDAITYKMFAERAIEADPEVMTIVNGARNLHRKKPINHAILDEGAAMNIIAEHTKFTNKVVARTMRYTAMPWLFRLHTMPPKKQTYDHALWAARYSNQPAPHESINAPQYCQVMSPLRRFPDLVNHLNLAASMDFRPFPYSEERVASIAHRMNEQMHHVRSSLLEAA